MKKALPDFDSMNRFKKFLHDMILGEDEYDGRPLVFWLIFFR